MKSTFIQCINLSYNSNQNFKKTKARQNEHCDQGGINNQNRASYTCVRLMYTGR